MVTDQNAIGSHYKTALMGLGMGLERFVIIALPGVR
jgi:hypothetical protein